MATDKKFQMYSNVWEEIPVNYDYISEGVTWMNDEKIIAMIAEKQQLGIEQLSKKYSAYANKVALSFFSSPQDAEECINDALWDVWKSESISEIKNLKAFIATCVRRRAVDMLRTNNAQKRSRNMTAILDELEGVCGMQTTESAFESREIGRTIEEFIRLLDPPDRDIFLMRYFYGMEIKEISHRLFLGRNAVDKRLSKCRKKLKNKLEENV